VCIGLLLIIDVKTSYVCKPHRLNAVHRCGLLLKMSHVAWLVCMSVCLCVGHMGELCKTVEPIEMPFGGLTIVGAMHHVLDGSRSRQGKVPPGGEETAMRPFAKLLSTLVYLCHVTGVLTYIFFTTRVLKTFYFRLQFPLPAIFL